MALVVVGSGLVQPQAAPTTIRWCCVPDCGALHASMVESGLSQAAAQTRGMERRGERRTGRQERRTTRAQGRHSRSHRAKRGLYKCMRIGR
jgi:hypothetical protein